MMVLGTILRFLFAWLDSVVAMVITLLYNLLTNLAGLVLYSESIVDTLGQRIGLLLGIFMLFRLAITLINYLISPDKIGDSSKGGNKLILNIVVSLFLLATVNYIFSVGYKIQEKVISSNIIEKIFFGAGDVPKVDVGYYLHSAFFTPNTNVINGCSNIWDNNIKLEQTSCNTELSNFLDHPEINEIHNARDNMTFKSVFSNYSLVLAKGNNGEFLFDYIPVLSTVAGVLVILILISFSMDLATRAVKLLFLQIIAPIPIISNMDPGKGKDIFQKWYKECLSTYVSVFIRLIAINFAMFMISLIKGNFNDIFSQDVILNVFIIIGCLMFAKQVPKLIEDMLGIKMEGMALNPLKKFQEQALFGKNITGLAAGATVGTIGALSGAGFLQGVKGGFTGLFGGKGFAETWKNQVSSNRNMRGYLAEGSTFWGRRAAQISGAFGIPTPSENIEADVHRIDEEIKALDNEIKPVKDSISDRSSVSKKVGDIESRADSLISSGKAGDLSVIYDTLKNRIEYFKQNGGTPEEIAKADDDLRKFARQAREDIINNHINGGSQTSRSFTDSTGTVYASTTMAAANQLDGVISSGYNDLQEMVAVAHNYIDDSGTAFTVDNGSVNSATNMHDIAGQIDSSISRDTRVTINPVNARKQVLEQRKTELYERQRVTKANQSAVSGK